MKKLITVCVGLIVAGCATTTQLDEANAKIQDLEKRLTAIEDLNKVQREVRKSERVASEQKRSEDVESRPSEDQRNAEREAEREEQRKQLLAIQEELRRVRESKVTANEEERKRAEMLEAEREEQRKQLLAIQEDLRRKREAAVVAAEEEIRRTPESEVAAAKEELRRKGEAQAAAAEEAARRAEREAERERERAELLAIQEELRRKREADVAAKEEERKRAEAEKAAKEAEEKKAVDAKIDAFLKEHLGVQFGDSIDKFPGEKQDANPNTRRGALLRSRGLAGEPTNSADTRNIPVLKKFKYFDKAYGKFFEGKLYRVEFRANIDKKYSFDSTREKSNQGVAGLAATLGLESSAFKDEPWHGVDSAPSHAYFRSMTSAPRTSYTLDKIFQSYLKDVWVYTVSFEDAGLRNRLREEKRKAEAEERRKKNATGETLPDPE